MLTLLNASGIQSRMQRSGLGLFELGLPELRLLCLEFFEALQAGSFSTLSHSLSYEVFASGVFIAFVIELEDGPIRDHTASCTILTNMTTDLMGAILKFSELMGSVIIVCILLSYRNVFALIQTVMEKHPVCVIHVRLQMTFFFFGTVRDVRSR